MENFREKLVEELASKGNRDAIFKMVRHHIYRNIDEIDVEKAEQIKHYLLKLAENNDQDAMVDLGSMYYVGKGIEQNYKEAVKWYEKAAEKLDEYGLCYLGYCYYHGRDIEIDYEKAYSCFSQSAFLGNANAMYKLGDMFFYGNYVKEDKDAAFFWYDEGWENGSDTDKGWENGSDIYVQSSIAYRLGKCYLHGYGVGSDIFLALDMLQQAEKGLFELIIEEGDIFAGITLRSVRKEIDTVRNRLYDLYEIGEK